MPQLSWYGADVPPESHRACADRAFRLREKQVRAREKHLTRQHMQGLRRFGQRQYDYRLPTRLLLGKDVRILASVEAGPPFAVFKGWAARDLNKDGPVPRRIPQQSDRRAAPLQSLRMKLSEIATRLGARLENGAPETEITGVAGIEAAGAGEITFISNPKYAAAARTTQAAAVIVAEDFPAISTAMLRSKNPYLDFARTLEMFHPATRYAAGVHPTAVVAASAKVGAGWCW